MDTDQNLALREGAPAEGRSAENTEVNRAELSRATSDYASASTLTQPCAAASSPTTTSSGVRSDARPSIKAEGNCPFLIDQVGPDKLNAPVPALGPTQGARAGGALGKVAKGTGGISKGRRDNQSAATSAAVAGPVGKKRGKKRGKKHREKKYVYAVVHDGTGRFFIFTKRARAYFFSKKGGGGTVLPQGSEPHGAGDHALPGGALESDDAQDRRAGALREFLEETGVDLSNNQWAPQAWPAPYADQEGKYYGSYFEFNPQAFDNLSNAIQGNLHNGDLAAQAVQAGQYWGQYDALRNAFPASPPDNELAANRTWNLSDPGIWDTIQGWESDENKGWFYQFLDNLRTHIQHLLAATDVPPDERVALVNEVIQPDDGNS